MAPAPAAVASLDALSCTAPDNCWALDDNDSQFIHWNGQSWAKPVRYSFRGPLEREEMEDDLAVWTP